jgi:hypothetical protein
MPRKEGNGETYGGAGRCQNQRRLRSHQSLQPGEHQGGCGTGRKSRTDQGAQRPPPQPDILSLEPREIGSPLGLEPQAQLREVRLPGLTLLFVGIAITLGLWGSGAPGLSWWWGLVPVALGLAFALTYPRFDLRSPAVTVLEDRHLIRDELGNFRLLGVAHRRRDLEAPHRSSRGCGRLDARHGDF